MKVRAHIVERENRGLTAVATISAAGISRAPLQSKMRVNIDLFRSQVCSRAALARVRAGAKREPVRAKHQEDERGLKPRDYILD